jgi:hypothetical protein
VHGWSFRYIGYPGHAAKWGLQRNVSRLKNPGNLVGRSKLITTFRAASRELAFFGEERLKFEGGIFLGVLDQRQPAFYSGA